MEESRSLVCNLIASIDPFDRFEREQIDFALEWAKSAPMLFRTGPTEPSIHLVSYFVPFDFKRGEILLVDHRKSGLWLPPGGHVEPDEDPTETVRREAQEELGIEARFSIQKPLFLTLAWATGHQDLSLWYLLNLERSEPIVYDEREFHQIRWFPLDQLPFGCSDPHLERFVDKLCQRFTEASYDLSAGEYAERTEALGSIPERERFAELLSKGGRVADLGCGPGRDSRFFVDRGLNVHGIDLSAEMVELARKRVPGAHFTQMAMEELAFPEGSFDGVWASASLHHLPKKRLLEVLKSVRELLKPGGLFYLTVKQGKGEGLVQDSRYGGLQKFYSYFELEEIVALLKEAQFHAIDDRVAEQRVSYETHPSIHLFCRR